MADLEVVIVQHAEKERAGGDVGLTDLGHRQAVVTASALGLEQWDRLWSSPMRRARQTGAPIAEVTGLTMMFDERLRERMNWAGPATQSRHSFLAEWGHATTDRDWTPPSGDSSAATGARFTAFLDHLLPRRARRVLAVAHGGVTVDGLRTLFGDTLVHELAPDALLDGVPSCGLTRLRHDGDRWSVTALGDTRHLQ